MNVRYKKKINEFNTTGNKTSNKPYVPYCYISLGDDMLSAQVVEMLKAFYGYELVRENITSDKHSWVLKLKD